MEKAYHPHGGNLASPTVFRDVPAWYGVRLRQELGQRFLADANTLRRVVELAAPRGDETAVEAGALTVVLAPHVQELVAVEVDRRLIPVLEETSACLPNGRIVHRDFRDVSLPSLGKGFLLVGNLPYGITSDVLLKVLREGQTVDRALFMVQREVGEKLVAPSGPERSRLGVHLQAYFDLAVVRKVLRTVFFLPPKVVSALVRLQKLTQPRITVREDWFERTLAGVRWPAEGAPQRARDEGAGGQRGSAAGRARPRPQGTWGGAPPRGSGPAGRGPGPGWSDSLPERARRCRRG